MRSEDCRAVVEAIAHEKVKQLKAGGHDFQSSLMLNIRMWNDPTHALLELLQNADDVRAPEVEIEVRDEGLVLRHNGDAFTARHVEAICSVDSSTKNAEEHTGFMGIGFKAVFRLSEAPAIINGPWRFGFSAANGEKHNIGKGWVLVPVWDPVVPNNVFAPDTHTTYWIPFRETLENGPMLAEHELWEVLTPATMLFFRHIRSLKITRGKKRRELTRTADNVNETTEKATVGHRFVVHKSTIRMPDAVKRDERVREAKRDTVNEREITLAFAQDEAGSLASLSDTPLYTTLPCNDRTGLRFVVQADFILDAARRGAEQGLEWNRHLWKNVALVLQNAIEDFKDDPKKQTSFYSVLPRAEDLANAPPDELDCFWKTIDGYMKAAEIVLTTRNKWVVGKLATIASNEFQALVDSKKLQAMTKRGHYVHDDVVANHKNIVKLIGVDETPDPRIMEALADQKWIEGQDRAWLSRLHIFLYHGVFNQRSNRRWPDYWTRAQEVKKLRLVPVGNVLMLGEGVLYPPKDEEEKKATIGLPGLRFTTLPEVTEEKLFLDNVEVKSCNADSLLKQHLLPMYKEGKWFDWSEADHHACLNFLRDYFDHREVPPGLHDLEFVAIFTERGEIVRAGDCYFGTPELRLIAPDANFVSTDVTEQEKRFYEILGVEDKPRVKSIDVVPSGQDPKGFKGYRDFVRTDHSYPSPIATETRLGPVPYLDLWSRKPDREAALTWLNILARNWPTYSRSLKANLSYVQRPGAKSSYISYVPSLVTWQLRTTPWLIVNGSLEKPSALIYAPTKAVKENGGAFASFVELPNGLDPEMKGLNELFELVNVPTEIGEDEAIHLLVRAMDLIPAGTARDELTPLYRRITEVNISENSVLGEVPVLTKTGEFETARTVYWNNDSDLGRAFEANGAPPFAWMPEGLPSTVYRDFATRMKITPLSSAIRRRLVESEEEPTASDLESHVKSRAIYVYSQLVHQGAERAADTYWVIMDSAWLRWSKLELIHELGEATLSVGSRCLIDEEASAIHLTTDAKHFDVTMEIVRCARLDLSQEALLTFILDHNEEDVRERFLRGGVSILPPPLRPNAPLDEATSVEPPPAPGDGFEPKQSNSTPTAEPPPAAVGGSSARPAGGAGVGSAAASAGPLGGQRGVTASPSRTIHGGGAAWPRYSDRGSGSGGSSSAPRVERSKIPYEERMRIEQENIARIIRFEENAQRVAEDVSRQYRGYDIESSGADGVRRIEVKSVSFVELTDHEHEVACKALGEYYVYIVDGDLLHILPDPATSCGFESFEKIEKRWRPRNWPDSCTTTDLPE